MSSEVKQTRQHILRAMVLNYGRPGPDHVWDRLDSEACAKAADEIAALEAENARFQSAIVGMIDLAHEYRRVLTQQRFPDNDEGDAFRRHRDAQVLRIERILSAAQAAKVESHE